MIGQIIKEIAASKTFANLLTNAFAAALYDPRFKKQIELVAAKSGTLDADNQAAGLDVPVIPKITMQGYDANVKALPLVPLDKRTGILVRNETVAGVLVVSYSALFASYYTLQPKAEQWFPLAPGQLIYGVSVSGSGTAEIIEAAW